MLQYKLTDDSELRLLMPYHAAELSQIVQDNYADLTRWFDRVTLDIDEAATREYILERLGELAGGSGLAMGIFCEGRLVGGVNYTRWKDRMRSAEISYWLVRAYRQRGLATLAVRALTDYAIATRGLHRVEIIVSPENHAATAIPRRLGYHLEGRREQWFTIHESPRDMDVYVMLAPNWQATPVPSLLSFPLTADADLRLMLPHHAKPYADLVLRDQDDLKVWLPWAEPFSEERAGNHIQHSLDKLAANDGLTMAIYSGRQYAGWINYHYWDWHNRRTEIGYWLGVAFRGRGLISQAVTVMTDYALTTLQLNRVDVLMDVRNTRSSAVPERLNFSREGGIRKDYLPLKEGGYSDAVVYYMLAENWHHRGAASVG